MHLEERARAALREHEEGQVRRERERAERERVLQRLRAHRLLHRLQIPHARLAERALLQAGLGEEDGGAGGQLERAGAEVFVRAGRGEGASVEGVERERKRDVQREEGVEDVG